MHICTIKVTKINLFLASENKLTLTHGFYNLSQSWIKGQIVTLLYVRLKRVTKSTSSAKEKAVETSGVT